MSSTHSGSTAGLAARGGSSAKSRAIGLDKAPPRSYRRLAEDLGRLEAGAAGHRSEEAAARSEAGALRNDLQETLHRIECLLASEASHRAALARRREEASELWNACTAPLQDQEVAIHTAARTATVLECAVAAGGAKVASWRSEYEDLGRARGSLRAEVEEGRLGHESIVRYIQGAESTAQALAGRCSDGERRVRVLEEAAVAAHERRGLLGAEASAQRLEVQTARQELEELERHGQGAIAGWWEDHTGRSEALDVETEVLQEELQHGQVALEGQTRESALWRERAYRSEASLLQLRGEDVAGGLRALGQQCAAYAAAGYADDRLKPI